MPWNRCRPCAPTPGVPASTAPSASPTMCGQAPATSCCASDRCDRRHTCGRSRTSSSPRPARQIRRAHERHRQHPTCPLVHHRRGRSPRRPPGVPVPARRRHRPGLPGVGRHPALHDGRAHPATARPAGEVGRGAVHRPGPAAGRAPGGLRGRTGRPALSSVRPQLRGAARLPAVCSRRAERTSGPRTPRRLGLGPGPGTGRRPGSGRHHVGRRTPRPSQPVGTDARGCDARSGHPRLDHARAARRLPGRGQPARGRRTGALPGRGLLRHRRPHRGTRRHGRLGGPLGRLPRRDRVPRRALLPLRAHRDPPAQPGPPSAPPVRPDLTTARRGPRKHGRACLRSLRLPGDRTHRVQPGSRSCTSSSARPVSPPGSRS
ncbi:exported hypothetical protein [Streptomyces misionensis JCM 4497]